MTPLVSIIIPCFNAVSYIEEAVDSVYAQTHPGFECLVVDDGSTDGSVGKLQKLLAKHPSLQVLQKPNGGRAAAINFGIARTSPESEYLVFFDADDVLHPEFISRCLAAFSQDAVVTVATQSKTFYESIDVSFPTSRSRFTAGRWAPLNLPVSIQETPFLCFYSCTGQGPWAMHRKKELLEAGLLEERLNQGKIHGNEDTDLFCKMALLGRVLYLPDALYYKREHTTNVTKTRDMGYDLFREIWDGRIRQMAAVKPEWILLLHYYQRMHRPLRDLKVAALAGKDFVQKPSLQKLRWFLKLLLSGLPTLVWGYPWFLTIFNARRHKIQNSI